MGRERRYRIKYLIAGIISLILLGVIGMLILEVIQKVSERRNLREDVLGPDPITVAQTRLQETAAKESLEQPPSNPPVSSTPPAKLAPPASALVANAPRPDSADPRFTRLDDGRSLFNESIAQANSLAAPVAQPILDLESVDAIFASYLWAFKELPEGGENHEIVAGLTGKNDKRVIFIPEDHPRLDTQGNLLDRWGTPYHFHKQSDSIIEIVSAGPDRRLWSNDDLSLGRESTP